MELRNFSKVPDVLDFPSMVQTQWQSYDRFLQAEISPHRRQNVGLEAILREIFPIKNREGTVSLEYVKYDLGQPRYTPAECRQLGITYGAPLRVRLRLVKPPEPVEDDVYLGDIPLMIGGGEFIINGAERAIVHQLHRSPG
ncbi:MAG: DNA-directed RNA polymerase subunit beta, partial [Planctomycetota bacterium]|nr:DNA-directed RNA polymerase subunit beta [Planctomycetota bacterium]